MKQETIIGIIAGSIIGTAFIIPPSFEIVSPGHRGVSVTLGKVSSDIKGEGFNFKKPWIEKIVEVSIQQNTSDGTTESFTSDLQTVTILYSCMYRLSEAKVGVLYSQYKGDPYETLVKPQIEEKMKQVSSTYTAEDLVKNREIAKQKVVSELREQLKDLIIVEDIILRNIELSAKLTESIELKQIEQQKSLKKKYEIASAEGEAQIAITKAKADAETIKIKAQAEAESIKIKSEALKDNPDIIDLEIISKWDGKSPTTVVSGSGRAANIVLPIK